MLTLDTVTRLEVVLAPMGTSDERIATRLYRGGIPHLRACPGGVVQTMPALLKEA